MRAPHSLLLALALARAVLACTTLKIYSDIDAADDTLAAFSVQEFGGSFGVCASACVRDTNCTAFYTRFSRCLLSRSHDIPKRRTPDFAPKLTVYALHQTSCRAFQSPSELAPLDPVDMSLFTHAKPNATLCEVYRPRGRMQVFAQFVGTRFDCVRECQYDSNCRAAFFRPMLCIKAVGVQLTDDSRAGAASEFGAAYIKLRTPVPYVQGYCSLYDTKNTCNSAFPRCLWNHGRVGINQNRVVMVGHCGRFTCVPGSNDE